VLTALGPDLVGTRQWSKTKAETRSLASEENGCVVSGHFRGAERLADRRRRWLATGSLQSAPGAATPDSDPQTAPPTLDFAPQRRCDAVEVLPQESPAPVLPLHRLIPRASWPYGVAGVMATALVAVLTCSAWPGAGGQTRLSPLWNRLLVPPAAELVTGLGTVALGLAGQLALVIGWGRSRSLVDYAGQYRTWTRAALACWLFAGVSRLGLDSDWRDWALHQNWPRFWNDTQLLGLLPTLLAGASLGAGLRREVARCQPSRTLLMVATTLYLTVVALKLGSGSSLAAEQRLLAIQNGMLAAHLALLLCFWIHARHILYETCDPVEESRRSNWLPAPHWFPRWRGRTQRPGNSATGQESTETPGAKTDNSISSAIGAEPQAEPGERLQRPTDASSQGEFPTAAGPFEAAPVASKGRSRKVVAGTAEQRELDVDKVALAADSPECTLVAPTAEEGYGQSVSEASEFPTGAASPSHKGLSKRERRRLLQEERLKGRADRG